MRRLTRRGGGQQHIPTGQQRIGVQIVDPAGHLYILPYEQFVTLLQANGGQTLGTAYMPLTLGDEPPTFVTDGAGRLMMVAFTP